MHRAKVVPTFNDIDLQVAKRFAAFRETEEYRKKAKNVRLDRQVPWLHIVVAELMRPAILNSREPIAESDTADLQHAVIGLMYCDLVLPYWKWAGRAPSLRQ